MGLVMLAGQLLGVVTGWVRTIQGELVKDHITGLVHRQCVRLDLAFYDSAQYFDRLHRARAEASYRPLSLLESLGGLLQNSITLVAMVALLLPYGAWLPAALLVSTLPALYIVLHFRDREHRYQLRVAPDERRTWYYEWLLTARETAAELRLFGLGERYRSGYQVLRRRLRTERLRLNRDEGLARLAASTVGMLVIGGVMIWMVWQAIQGNANLGDLAMLYAALNQGQGLMRSLLEGLGGIYGNSLFLGDLFEFLALEPQVVDPAQPVSLPKDPGQETGDRGQESGDRRQESGVRSQESGVRSQESGVRNQETGDGGQESHREASRSGDRSQESGDRRQESGDRSQESEVRSPTGMLRDQEPEEILHPSSLILQPSVVGPAIAFHGVTFRYPGSAGTRTVLHDLDFAVAAGQVAAIVGPNGAGKSTLIKLLCRFYDPQAGRVEMDGVDLRTLPLDALRSRIAILFQTPVTYYETAAENIAIGGQPAEPGGDVTLRRAAIETAAQAAGADGPISRLPQGYDTVLGTLFEGGTDLSTGEWQRIALARAFYRQAPVVVLDEPTSAMDSWAEADWLARFRSLVAGKTAIIITHRFTTARYADVIHVMEGGRIVESGTHDALLALGGRYAQSWQAQMQTDSSRG